MQCERLVKERTALFQDLLDNGGFTWEDEIAQFKRMLSKDCLKITSRHVYEMFERRREILYAKSVPEEEEMEGTE